jgi:hypothetical protein
MKRILTKISGMILLISFAVNTSYTQEKGILSTENQIWDNYIRYRETAINHRLFKHSDIVPLMQKHTASGLLKNEILGKSVQGRSIHHLSTGTGKTKVLLWSQMHGDESTATMALFDLFNFLAADDEFNDFRKNLLSKLELHFIPMLNPDGAQIWTRRNAMDIDINRDAQNLATPEANILMGLGKQLRPQFGFNLHDQSIYYNAGNTNKPATISFLAPAFNKAKDMNEVRRNATKVIVAMNNALQTKESGQVAKYDDTFDARCFGDQFMSMGISSILIESGGYLMDPEKQQIRKLNFYALITALNAIAQDSYQKEDLKRYWSIPDNNRNLYDLIVRNVEMPGTSKPINLGIIRHQQIDTNTYKRMDYVGKMEKIEDGKNAFGYQEIDASGLTYMAEDIYVLAKNGIRQANFILYQEDRAKYIVLNGHVFEGRPSTTQVIIAPPPPAPKKP